MAPSWSFNPRTREGCDVNTPLSSVPPFSFQSTHPRGVRRGLSLPKTCSAISFNPRTREGCDELRDSAYEAIIGVSIHAPARGATYSPKLQQYEKVFQSTHPRGVRLYIKKNHVEFKNVSIHAPARGATASGKVSMPPGWFQSTHPRGVRQHIQKCIEYQYAKLCFLRHNAKLLKTRHILRRRKRQPPDFQRLR